MWIATSRPSSTRLGVRSEARKLDRDTWIAIEERREPRHEVPAREEWLHGDADDPRGLDLATADARAHGLEVFEDPYRAFVELLASVGQGQSVRIAQRELHAELFLECRDLLAYRGLADPSSRATAENVPRSTTRTNVRSRSSSGLDMAFPPGMESMP